MAKDKKRNKKYNHDLTKRITITRAVTSMLGSMFFIGDNRHAPTCFSESKLQSHIKGDNLIKGRAALRDLLVFGKATWSLLVIGFVKNDDEVEVITGTRATDEITGLEFFSNFIPYVHETLHEMLKANDLTADDLHSYGYFANMCDIYDLDKLEPNLIDRFFRIGLGDDNNSLNEEELVGFEDFITSTSKVFMPKVVAGEAEVMIMSSEEDISTIININE